MVCRLYGIFGSKVNLVDKLDVGLHELPFSIDDAAVSIWTIRRVFGLVPGWLQKLDQLYRHDIFGKVHQCKRARYRL
jgi:hypothetical protein